MSALVNKVEDAITKEYNNWSHGRAIALPARKLAVAAILAMRQVPDEVYEAGGAAMLDEDAHGCVVVAQHIWEAMIDKALKG